MTPVEQINKPLRLRANDALTDAMGSIQYALTEMRPQRFTASQVALLRMELDTARAKLDEAAKQIAQIVAGVE